MSRNKKFMLLLAVVLILTFSISSMAVGAPLEKIVKIFNNGQLVTGDKNPIIIEGTTYVPLRMLGNIFNKTVDWDGAAYSVLLTDKPDNNVKELQAKIDQLNIQIADRDSQIIVLKAQLEALQKAKEEKDSKLDLDDMEDLLMEDYDEYKGIEFEINLKGKASDITVAIEVDLDDYKSKWNKLSESNKKSYLQDIVDDILDQDEFEDADIEGYIEDIADDKDLLTFYVNNKGKVVIEKSGIDLDDLAEDLFDDYYDFFSGIEFEEIELDGDEDEIEFYVYLDYDYYEDEWEDLSTTSKKNFMRYICEDILDEYEDAEIYGYVLDDYDDDVLYEYEY